MDNYFNMEFFDDDNSIYNIFNVFSSVIFIFYNRKITYNILMGILKLAIVMIGISLFFVLASNYYQIPLNIHEYLKYI